MEQYVISFIVKVAEDFRKGDTDFHSLPPIFFIYFGGQALGLLPPNLVTDLPSTLAQWARQVGL